LATLSPELPVAMLVLAPLPECYLYRFLQRVDPLSRFNLVLARDGLPLKSGVAYLVPYDYGVSVGSRGSLAVGLCARQNHGFSSVDAMLSSLATRYGPAVIGVILAGSGHDGVAGAVDVRAAGGTVIVQDQATCLVCETPAAVIQAGAATSVVPLEQIADEIARYVSHNQADSPAMLRSR
jgi:two-component system chemotaxis response regulator CheB